jgi:glycosyltransferase involved in cell wall biosynthesis
MVSDVTVSGAEKYRKMLKLKDSNKVIGCVAELIPRKNHSMIIDSAAEVIQSDKNVIFLFVGSGSHEKKLKDIIKEKGLEEYFLFTGRIDDVPSILGVMDIFVLVSIYEGLPRAIQEGMAVGLPIIASDIRGNSDLITDGENGYLVKLGDSTDLTDKIVKLLKNEGQRKFIGDNNRVKIEEKYSLDIVQKQMKSIYTKILGADNHNVTDETKIRN